MKKLIARLAFFTSLLAPLAAYADSAYEGMAKPWQLGFQEAATPVMQKLTDIHEMLLYIITTITVLVLIVMAYIVIRYRRKANPVPSKTTHNTKLEIIWTTIPILILIVIAIPSLRLHYYMQRVVDPEMTVKVVGYQWYWHYEYPDQGGFGFDSYIKKGADLKPDDHRQLSVDNRLVVPVDTTIKVQLTGADVIHSWAVPAFGVKRDAIPGRLNETWFRALKVGTFYGQCSQLCGVGHGFMPVVVEVVSKDDFKAWTDKKKQEAGIGNKPVDGTAADKDATAQKKAPEPAAAPKKAKPVPAPKKKEVEEKDSDDAAPATEKPSDDSQAPSEPADKDKE